MSALQVVVRPSNQSTPKPSLEALYGLVDFVVDGVNVTARIGETQAVALLGELAVVVAELAQGRRDRAALQLYADGEAWELGLEVDGGSVLVSVFRSGPCPEVAVFEREVSFGALKDGVERAVTECLAEDLPSRARRGLEDALRAIAAAWPPIAREKVQRDPTRIAPQRARGLSFEALVPLRSRAASTRRTSVERADLHALLSHGPLVVHGRGRRAQVGSLPVFLFAERMVMLAEDVLDSWQVERPLFRRFEVAGAHFGARRAAGDGPVALTVKHRELGDSADGLTFPEIDAVAFTQAAVRFARALATAIVDRDPDQDNNLRLVALRDGAHALADRLEQATEDDACTNPMPESYRHYPLVRRGDQTKGRWSHGASMRFLPRWVATVPAIDLRSTFLCGDRLVVGSRREMACLDRESGDVLWRVPSRRAVAVVTPAALCRLHPDGTLTLHDLETGEARRSTRVTPRGAGGATGAVVHAPGLPKVLILQEGERKITAIDLVSGDVRWRHTVRRPGAYRMRRAGRLVLVSGGDTAFVALDVATGEVVWRARGRLPFSSDITVAQDAVYLLGGGRAGRHSLHCFDPWTGREAWSTPVGEAPIPDGRPS